MIAFSILDGNDSGVLQALFVNTHQHRDLVLFVVGVNISALIVDLISVLKTDEHSCLKETQLLEHGVVRLRGKAHCLILFLFVKRATLRENSFCNYQRRTLLGI